MSDVVEFDRTVLYVGKDGWGNTRRAEYPVIAGTTPPRYITRFGCKLFKVEVGHVTKPVDWKAEAHDICKPQAVAR